MCSTLDVLNWDPRCILRLSAQQSIEDVRLKLQKGCGDVRAVLTEGALETAGGNGFILGVQGEEQKVEA